MVALFALMSACATTPSQSPQGALNENQVPTSNQHLLDNQRLDNKATESAFNKGLSETTETQRLPSRSIAQETDTNENPALLKPADKKNTISTPNIAQPGRMGKLTDSQLNEISGLTASVRYPGLLYAINDSGNQPKLFAIDQTGRLIDQWDLNAKNRDWEDMTRMTVGGEQFLVIGDTGDNLRIRESVDLLLIREPNLSASSSSAPGSNSNSKSIKPTYSIQYRYEDGPRNVEAIAAIGNTLFLLSKEPVNAGGRSPSGIYSLTLSDTLSSDARQPSALSANRVGTMPLRAAGLESALAITFAGVDLSHPTAMEFDAGTNSLYILTYREVLRVQRRNQETWASALSRKAELVLAHNLRQAEALTVIPGQAVWFTSENTGAPLWAIPLNAPL